MDYQMMLYGGLAGVAMTLPVAVILYVKLQITEVLEDVTGLRLRRRSKETVHEEQTEKRTTNEIQIKKQYAEAEAADETALMSGAIEQTTLLEAEETTILTDAFGETVLLEAAAGHPAGERAFELEKRIMIVHSADII